jgi:hypothetical protein
MSFLLLILHLFSGIFLGGLIILGISAHFSSPWASFIQRHEPLWEKFSWVWSMLLVLLFFALKSYFHFEQFEGHKRIYFSDTSVLGRILGYILVSTLSLRYLKKLPSLHLILFFIIGNLFAFDWAMSLEHHWFSNMYGLIYLGNGVAGAMALMMLLHFKEEREKTKMDLTHLLLVFCIFGLYLHFSQFIILWMGNLPREVIFYLERLELYGPLPIVLMIFLKLVPIILISLSRNHKTNDLMVRIVCGLILLAYGLETLWQVSP